MNTPTPIALPPLPASELTRLDALLPLRRVTLAQGQVQTLREAGAGDVTLVCLHGIGSGAASWINLAALLPRGVRLLAWDAPGYGESTPLATPEPRAMDYARRLDEMLSALDIQRCIVIGHSLGAFAASAFTQELAAGRVQALGLINPAMGYGQPERAEQRASMRAGRLAQIEEPGGIAQMAERRAQRLLSKHADQASRQWVRWNMARLNDGGYRQAIEMLAGDDLLRYLPPSSDLPCRVACGELDVVTPPAACETVAKACGVPLEPIERAGHASYVEQAPAVLRWIASLARNAGLHLESK